MTPESKAIDIVAKLEQGMTFMSNVRMRSPQAKQCALIAVKEMISLWEEHAYPHPHYGSVKEDLQQVKQAIEKM